MTNSPTDLPVQQGRELTDPGSRIVIMNFSTEGPTPLPFKSFRFTGGEVHVKFEPFKRQLKDVIIIAPIQSSDDLMTVLLLTDAVRSLGNKLNTLSLYLPYLPYARQDRVMEPGEALSIKVLARLLNSCNFDYVQVEDPHSDVGPALIDNCRIKEQWELVMPFLNSAKITNPIFVAPDAGALKKVTKLTQKFGPGADMIRADKTRDTATGRITGTVVYPGDVDITDTKRPIVIVDDICDGGATFVGLAKELKKLTKSKIILYVTNGIFSKGFDELGEVLDEIWVSHSFLVGPQLNHGFKPEEFRIYTAGNLPPVFTPPV